jgi:copper homeostasis protein
MAFLEIACFNAESALIAQDAGADRIELCADAHLGGTTPSRDTFVALRPQITRIPIFIMIRPRGGSDFVYTDAEFQRMKEEISAFKQTGRVIDGFVFGILDGKSRVDKERNHELVELAKPAPCTFHRAFDEINAQQMEQALEDIVECGFKSILTSGGEVNALTGASRLADLVKAAGQRIAIIVGGGVRSSNVQELQERTGAEFFHSSAITDGGEVASLEEVRSLRASLH